MNARFAEPRPSFDLTLAPVAVAALGAAQAAAGSSTSRHLRRERDFGVGYGNSSGYASERRYISNHTQPLFRCA